VKKGVGCVSCHGRIDDMAAVYQAEPLNMGWCLDCHRNPEPHLRPRDQITNMGWRPRGVSRSELGARLAEAYDVNPQDNCYTCHR
jgi:hypothetical protein